jgi:hypothetical protein
VFVSSDYGISILYLYRKCISYPLMYYVDSLFHKPQLFRWSIVIL